MKSLSLFFSLVFGCLCLPLAAQQPNTAIAADKNADPQWERKDHNILPAKQVVLLHEVTNLKEEDMIDDPDHPEMEPDQHKLASQVYQLNVLLHLFSTGDIAKIHVKIGTRPGAADHAAYSFTFDEELGLPAPFSYARDGKTVLLGMGEVMGINNFHVEVILESTKGKLSAPSYYNPE